MMHTNFDIIHRTLITFNIRQLRGVSVAFNWNNPSKVPDMQIAIHPNKTAASRRDIY